MNNPMLLCVCVYTQAHTHTHTFSPAPLWKASEQTPKEPWSLLGLTPCNTRLWVALEIFLAPIN